MATTWSRCPRCGKLGSIIKVGSERMCVACANKVVVIEPRLEVRK